MRRPLIIPGLLTIALLAARLLAVSPLSDPTGAALPSGLRLATPLLYLAFAPVFTLWDGVSMLSMSRLKGFLVGVAILYAAWRVAVIVAAAGRRRSAVEVRPGRLRRVGRELGLLVLSLAVLVSWVVVGAVWHRPMVALSDANPDEAIVDFHSHTTVSHDVKGLMDGYDLAANLRWHQRAGFDAVFITDHNTTDGWRGKSDSSPPPAERHGQARTVACPGIEVSAWRAHIVLLGDSADVDHGLYDQSLDGVLTLLREAGPRYNSLSVASTPEYVVNHWANLDQFIAAGVDGFEVVNASPKANAMTVSQRDSVIALAHANNRFVVGVSDSHGWGATSMAWTLVSIPRWRDHPETLCAGILEALRRGGFAATRIVERHRLRPDDRLPDWLTPVGVLWETWRSLDLPLTLSWLAWVWAPVGLVSRSRRGDLAESADRRQHIPPAS